MSCKIPGYNSIAEFERLNNIAEGTTKRQLQRGYCQWPRVINDGRKSHYLYSYWRSIIDHCTVKGHTSYSNYGGRGIKICHLWRHNFWQFVTDIESLGQKPSSSHSLDRINVNGDYELLNLRWADKTIQSNNQRLRKDNKSHLKGLSYSGRDKLWRVRIVQYHIKLWDRHYKSKLDAITDLINIRKQLKR